MLGVDVAISAPTGSIINGCEVTSIELARVLFSTPVVCEWLRVSDADCELDSGSSYSRLAPSSMRNSVRLDVTCDEVTNTK